LLFSRQKNARSVAGINVDVLENPATFIANPSVGFFEIAVVKTLRLPILRSVFFGVSRYG
jgi:hypothetical protein